ncbi:peptide arylation enzyme [Pseudoxanthomonas jiangsuensis]|uniref:AMP-binding protein n=1 Tax=Pseudoxanthomonas jiangsuensis TaxID=619688 RepID=UPI0013910C52|nr:AMP-binding protein [Pseudoxanthomonas jiangsuensis]KAF1697264.1 peptide arylation enzyme [Pseudoxanthomonas jiangsuensis]
MYSVKDPIPGVSYAPPERLQRYVESGELKQITLAEALIASFERNATGIALATEQGDITYAQLAARTDTLAASLLGLGLRPLDRVIFQSGNSVELIEALIACFKAGLIPVCTLAAHREMEIEYLGVHAAARAHIVQGDDTKFDLPAFALRMKDRIPTMEHVISLRGDVRDGVHRAEDLVLGIAPDAAKAVVAAVPRDPFQVAVFQLSGGTTGVPKIIPRIQNDYLLNAELGAEVMGFGNGEVLFMPMPMIHNAAMVCFLLPSLLTGATFAIPSAMTPEAWGWIFTHKKPTFIGMIRSLLPRLDSMIEGGHGTLERVRGAWAPDGAKVIREKYGVTALPMFGMSEGLNLYCRADDPEEARDWTVGRPLSALDEVRLINPETGQQAALGEVGLLTCRGPYTLCGYYDAEERNAEAFTDEGFYRSSDLMIQREIDGKRYFAFAGRTADVVSRGHEKINCEELEGGVLTHPAVSTCAVVGMPDPVLGERACVYIVTKESAITPSVEELGVHLAELGFAKFKWPERIELVDALPLTKVGKLNKSALREDIREKLAKSATS